MWKSVDKIASISLALSPFVNIAQKNEKVPYLSALFPVFDIQFSQSSMVQPVNR